MENKKIIAKEKMMLEEPYTHKILGVFMDIGDTDIIRYIDGCCYSVRSDKNGEIGTFNQNNFEFV